MLFDPSGIIASTTPSVSSLYNYMASPIIRIGFMCAVGILVLAAFNQLVIRKGIRGVVRAATGR